MCTMIEVGRIMIEFGQIQGRLMKLEKTDDVDVLYEHLVILVLYTSKNLLCTLFTRRSQCSALFNRIK